VDKTFSPISLGLESEKSKDNLVLAQYDQSINVYFKVIKIYILESNLSLKSDHI